MIEWPAERIKVADLKPFERNPRKITPEAYARLKSKIERLGFNSPVQATHDLRIIGGHQRCKILRELGVEEVLVMRAPYEMTDEQFREALIESNVSDGDWDIGMLQADFTVGELEGFGLQLDILGSGDTAKANGSLSERFGIPPFSVLNARDGWWQDRKRAWLALGIKSEVGRGDNLLKMSDTVKLSRKVVKATSCATDWMKRGPAGEDGKESTGTSIFDPVLCELLYRWFVPSGGIVVDPFAGGSVRGIVAGRLGLQYRGVDLRREQVEANRQQAGLCEGFAIPQWEEGDSLDIGKILSGVSADFLFSCPPYGDLEQYSEDPRDISTMDFDHFLAVYRQIIFASCQLLKQDSFACFVVGDIRGPAGNYRNFVSATIDAFIKAGLALYNEAILVTAIGSLPIRIGKQFGQYRKLGKTHQNVLIFLKGSMKAATAKLSAPEFGTLAFDVSEAATHDPQEQEAPSET